MIENQLVGSPNSDLVLLTIPGSRRPKGCRSGIRPQEQLEKPTNEPREIDYHGCHHGRLDVSSFRLVERNKPRNNKGLA